MFEFSVFIIGKNNISLNESFDFLVKTINSSGKDFCYEGSSTIVGATIYLRSKHGSIIRPDDIPVTNDYHRIVIKNNAVIKRIWHFRKERIIEPGWYDLYIEFFDSKEIIKDYIYIR